MYVKCFIFNDIFTAPKKMGRKKRNKTEVIFSKILKMNSSLQLLSVWFLGLGLCFRTCKENAFSHPCLCWRNRTNADICQWTRHTLETGRRLYISTLCNRNRVVTPISTTLTDPLASGCEVTVCNRIRSPLHVDGRLINYTVSRPSP